MNTYGSDVKTVDKISTGTRQANQAAPSPLRQAMEMLPLIFNPGVCPGMQARILFSFSGADPNVYTLDIANQACTLQSGACSEPTLSIQTASDTWLAILRSQVSAQEALAKGLLTVQGDTSILQQWGQLFQRSAVQIKNIQAPAGQRPLGPIHLSGTAWMNVALIPWAIYWITFGSFGLPAWVTLGIPLALSAILVVYRLIYNRPDWLELGGLAFFTLGSGLSLAGVAAFPLWSTIWSNLFVGMLWFASIAIGHEPLSMQYARWQYDRRVWHSGLFLYTNALVSLVWGFQSVLAGLIGCIGIYLPAITLPVTIARYLTILPGIYLTNRCIEAVKQKPPADVSRMTGQLRIASEAGIIFGMAILFYSIFIH